MPTDQNPKQLVAQHIKDATNILVTVSHDPSVDELSAALAMTLMLDKLGKVATAVFSGQIPPAIEFLEPGKTFDTNVDGLRDFIIALDKAKADRLRYKVEDDVVRVFITPYKTTITEKDLRFSQGDFNVDLIVAFGVEKHDDLDTAITAHGRILHDARIVTVNLAGTSSLGEVDWSDTAASSLSEMLMSLSESLQSGLLDEQIATAILTGLVSATDRFRNDKTSPKVMTMAAQLMAAGANQQLIAEKLEASSEGQGIIVGKDDTSKKTDNGEMRVDHEAVAGEDSSVDAATTVVAPTLDQALDVKTKEIAAEESADAIEEVNAELAAVVPEEPVVPAKSSSWRDAPSQAPTIGGTLNATSEQAEEDNRREEQDDKNHVLLSHDSPSIGSSPAPSSLSVLNASSLNELEPQVEDIFAAAPSDNVAPSIPVPTDDANTTQSAQPTGSAGLVFDEQPLLSSAAPVAAQNQTLADLEAEVHKQEQGSASVDTGVSVDAARAAVEAALGGQPFNPAGQPLASSGAQPLGEVAHDNPVPMTAALPDLPPPPIPGMPPLPPLPDFSTLPPLPGETIQPVAAEPTAPSFGLPEQSEPSTPSANPTFPMTSGDPAQFKLPGQS